jgi:hypothetical protein
VTEIVAFRAASELRQDRCLTAVTEIIAFRTASELGQGRYLTIVCG